MNEIWLDERVALGFAAPELGRAVLTTRDDFITCMSPFDRSVRLHAGCPIGQEELLAFISSSVRAWQPAEIDLVRSALAGEVRRLARYARWLPDRVGLVKTSGAEEAHSAYTCGNAVILPENKLQTMLPDLTALITHELFHVISRHHPALRDDLYAILGYHPCGPVLWPAELQARRITNPDAPHSAHYIRVWHEDQSLAVIPVLCADVPAYDPGRGGDIFDYVTFRLLGIEQEAEGWRTLLRDGAPLCLEVDRVVGFYEQIGSNTDYIIHPEETLASNFAFLALDRWDVPSPGILHRMAALLSGA